MPLFEDEKWEVIPQMVENVRRGEAVSHVGYLIKAVGSDGHETPLVDDHGIGASDRDHVAAMLFAVSKDMFNAVEALMPVLSTLDLNPSEEEALGTLETALRDVKTASETESNERMPP